jgi:hypothetical protein
MRVQRLVHDGDVMSQEITREERRANIQHWQFQHKLMLEQGFRLTGRQRASGKPRCYETADGQWRISTALKHKWKLEQWSGRYLHTVLGAPKIWNATTIRFDTPLAVALWFNMAKRWIK